VLGLVERRCLGLPDGGLDDRSDEQLAAVVAAIRALRPALCLVPHTSARHPDHAAAGRLGTRAAWLAGLRAFEPHLGAPHRPRVLVYGQRHELTPEFVVDISEVHDRKWAAIRCHRSQLGQQGTMVGASLGLDAFEVRDRYWGASIGVSHGEPYGLGGPVPVADPVQLLGSAPAPVLVPPR
jgi:LmbE family N-acetylglucosaminyl deacetylase